MKKLIFISIFFLLFLKGFGQKVGIGTTTPLQKLHVEGKVYVKDSVGIGIINPHAPLQFSNNLQNRKIVLWEGTNNDHQYYGLGINGSVFRYQVSALTDNHIFYAGATGTTSNELMRIRGDGTVCIGPPTPGTSAILDVSSTTKGALLPRMTTVQRNAIVSPATGLMVFNLDDKCLDVFDGTSWIKNCGLKITGTDTLPTVWTQKVNFGGSAREGAVGFSIGAKGYMGTGYDGAYKKDLWEYDPVTNVWTQKADLTGSERSEAVGIAIYNTSNGQTRGYVGSGKNASAHFNDWWEYNAISNTWTQKNNFPGAPRAEAAGFSFSNYGYIGTGRNGSTWYHDFLQYDVFTDAWSFIPDFPYDTYGAAAFSDGGTGFVGTGWFPGLPPLIPPYTIAYFYKYHQGAGSWIQIDDYPGGGIHSAVGFSINGEGFIGTGQTTAGALLNNLFEYNGSDWIQIPAFPGTARKNATAFAVGGKAYIGTGHDGNLKQDFWECDVFPQGNIYTSPVPTPLYSINDGIWTKELNNIYNVNTGNVGIGTSNPTNKLEVIGNASVSGNIGIGLITVQNKLDIQSGPVRTGSHVTGRSLYVTGPFSSGSNGIEFRHDNGTQGIGFGFNTIYAAGSNTSQDLGLAAKGSTGSLTCFTNGAERLRIIGDGKIGVMNNSPTELLSLSTLSTFSNTYMLITTAGGNQYKAGIKLRHLSNGYGWTLESNDGNASFELRSHQNDATGELTMAINGNTGNMSLEGIVISENFIAMPLDNGFANFGGNFATAAYYMDKMGRVHLRGLVNIGTNPNGVTMCTLPPGYRPSNSGQLIFTSMNNGNMGRIDIYPDGNITVVSGVAGWFSLDGISFRAD